MPKPSERDVRLSMLREDLAGTSPAGRISKVRRLRDALFRMIERGFWRPGEKLPGHEELAAYVGFSLGTVQAAMRSLAETGIIESRRGAGTFIAQAQALGRHVWNFRFVAADGQSLVPFQVRVLSVEETVETGDWARFLRHEPAYVKIRRQIGIGHEFTVYAEFFVGAARFRPLLDIPPEVLDEKNLRVFLHERFNAPTLRAVHRVRNEPVDRAIADLIGCAPGTLVLHMSALGFSYRDAPLSFQHFYVPPNSYTLEILG
jgi:DNA-binding GntR family transcriptional regulator